MKPSPGYSAALADNPDCADLLAALAAMPACETPSVAPRVLAAIRLRARLRRAVAGVAAVAAVAAIAFLATPRPSNPSTLSTPSSSLATLQRADGSWAADRGGEAMAPAATALAMLELAAGAKDDPAAAEALARGAAWLRAHQNADGSFGAAPAGTAAGAYNLALGATALLRLYEAGGHSELFTPIDAAVAAVRARLAAAPADGGAADVPLASALALADTLEWPDANAGDLRRAMRRLSGAGFAPVAGEPTFEGKRAALASLAGRI